MCNSFPFVILEKAPSDKLFPKSENVQKIDRDPHTEGEKSALPEPEAKGKPLSVGLVEDKGQKGGQGKQMRQHHPCRGQLDPLIGLFGILAVQLDLLAEKQRGTGEDQLQDHPCQQKHCPHAKGDQRLGKA